MMTTPECTAKNIIVSVIEDFMEARSIHDR